MANNAFANILNAINKMQTSGGNNSDDTFWKAETDKAGNGFAVIRFLPAKSEEDIPFVRMYDHGFKGPGGKWFIEKCPTTIGHECPVCQDNGRLWGSGRESDKDIVRQRKRRESYVMNIMVLSDPKNPDNEGKIFKFKCGKKLFAKLKDAMCPPPEFPDEAPMNPFDVKEGANFKLKIRKVDGYSNFDKSEFEKPEPLKVKFDADQLHDLNSLVDPKVYKEFNELEKKFKLAIGGTVLKPVVEDDDVDVTQEIPDPTKTKAAKKVAAPAEEDDLDYFRSLAED